MTAPTRGTSLRSLAAMVALAASAPCAAAQSTPPLQVISDTRANWLNGGAESPNGRFFLLDPYAGDTLLTYDRVAKRWTGVPGAMLGNNMSWSPNGRFVVSWTTISGRQSVMLTPMDTGTGRPSGPSRRISTRVGRWPVWSPTGESIAFVSADSGRFKVVVVPFNGGDDTVLFDGPIGVSGGLAWSPDGRTLLFEYLTAGRKAEYQRVDVSSRAVATFPASGRGLLLGYSADGARVAHIDRTTGILSVISATDGRLLTTRKLGQRVAPTGWSKTDANAMVGFQHIMPAHVEEASFPSGVIRSLTASDSLLVGDPYYSPDGRQIAFVGEAGVERQIRVMARTGGASRAIGAAGVIDRLYWAPSGGSIAYCNLQSVHVVDVASGRDRELTHSEGPPRLSPQACRWRDDGGAIRFFRMHNFDTGGAAELREVTLSGEDRLLMRLEGAAGYTSQQLASGAVTAQLLDDTLLVVQSATKLWLRNLRSNAERVLYSGSPFTREFDRSPDGRTLAFGVREGNNVMPHLVDLVSGDVRRVAYSLGGWVNGYRFHPDGRHLVFSACLACADPQGAEKNEIVVVPLNGDPARVLTAAQRSYRDHGRPDIAPDGRTIVFQAETSYNTRIVRIPVPR